MYNYNRTEDSPNDSKKSAFLSILHPEVDPISNCCHNFRKSAYFLDVVYFIDEENIVTYGERRFYCGISLYTEAPTKVRQNNQEWKNIYRSCEKHKCILSNDQLIFSIDVQHASIILLNPFKSRDMYSAAFMSLNHTTNMDCICNQ